MGNRSRTEIVSNILDAANGGVPKTKIMYKAYLSYNQLREYLSILIENNLIEYLDGTNKFKTTEKGLNLLVPSRYSIRLFSIKKERYSRN